MSALSRFLSLSPQAQGGYVDRVRGQLCDEPEGFAQMAAIVDERRKDEKPLPGGTSHAEKIAHEHRLIARMIDQPDERHERRDPAPPEPYDVFSPFSARKRGFVPARPWERH